MESNPLYPKFQQYHLDNPLLWKLIRHFTIDLIDAGWDHYGFPCLWEHTRYHMDVTSLQPDSVFVADGELLVQMNNNYRAFYARLFHAVYPEWGNFFEIRRLKQGEPENILENYRAIDRKPLEGKYK